MRSNYISEKEMKLVMDFWHFWADLNTFSMIAVKKSFGKIKILIDQNGREHLVKLNPKTGEVRSLSFDRQKRNNYLYKCEL